MTWRGSRPWWVGSEGSVGPLQCSWAELQPLIELRLEFWLRAVRSEARLEQARELLARQTAHQDLARRWDQLDARQRAEAVTDLEQQCRDAAYATRPRCLRCGRCCKNAGPTLYAEDLELLRQGLIPGDQLRVIPAGTEVHDHRADQRRVLERDCVTLRPAAGGWCALYDPAQQACTIHEHRPLQCRVQRCWDTAEAEALAQRPGLAELPPG